VPTGESTLRTATSRLAAIRSLCSFRSASTQLAHEDLNRVWVLRKVLTLRSPVERWSCCSRRCARRRATRSSWGRWRTAGDRLSEAKDDRMPESTAVERIEQVVCTFDLDFAALAQRIHQAIADSSTLAGQLVRVNRPS
jgi:hypothetical protein